jgi:ectoine hydroxylase-related dioxygenase (phytanoyl-CoA dioxygenase family)
MAVRRFRFEGSVQPRQRAFYEEHGFIIYEGFLSSAEVDRIAVDADLYQAAIRSGSVPPAHIDTVAPVTLAQDGSVREHHRLNYFTFRSPFARDFAASPRMDAIRRGIGGEEYWLLERAMNGVVWQQKSGEARSGYSSIRWHLDFPVGHTLSPAFTAGLYLDEARRSNGCLAVVPGSHRFPVGLVPPEPLYLEVSAGDLVCHHERIYHGSENAERRSHPRATLYFYYCAGTRPSAEEPYAGPSELGAIRSVFVGATEEGLR